MSNGTYYYDDEEDTDIIQRIKDKMVKCHLFPDVVDVLEQAKIEINWLRRELKVSREKGEENRIKNRVDEYRLRAHDAEEVVAIAQVLTRRWETQGIGKGLPGEHPNDSDILDSLTEAVHRWEAAHNEQ